MHVAPKAASVWLFKAGSTTLPETPSGDRPEDFGRHRRILKTDEFSSVFRLRPVKRTEHFALYQQANALGHARLGIVVAKRLAQRAVTRNMIKRMAREIFRRSELTASALTASWVQDVRIDRESVPGQPRFRTRLNKRE